MLYRTLLALPTPDAWHGAIIMSISDLQKQLPAGSVQWEFPNRTHLTLQFLGDTPHVDVTAIQQALTGTLAHEDPVTFQLGTDGYGVFYADGQPRFIFRSIDPMDEVLELHRQVVRTTEMLGYQPPDFTFVPHATLGRVNQDLSDDDLSAVRKFAAEDAVGNTNLVEPDPHVFDSIRFYWSDRDSNGDSEYRNLGDIHIGNSHPTVGHCESCFHWDTNLPENFVHRSVDGYGVCKRAMLSTMDPHDIQDMMMTLVASAPRFYGGRLWPAAIAPPCTSSPAPPPPPPRSVDSG